MNLTRRQAMKLGAGALATTALGGCVSRRCDGLSVAGFIDAHSHVWSGDLDRYPLGAWATRDNMQPATFNTDELLAVVRPCGVDRVVLIQHAPLHGYDNSYILDSARERPGTFSVVAMINERTPNLRERLRDLRDQGARGIRIGPTIHADRTPNEDPPNWLKSPGQQLLWRHAAELGVAICPLVTGDFLPSVDAMCQQHPDTVCVLDHFGRIDINNPDHVRSLTGLARHRQVYLKVSAFRNFGDQQAPYGDLVPLMRLVIDAFGSDRLMWGSDCPYQLNDGNNYEDAINLIRFGMDDLSESDRWAILRDTADGVFF